MHTTDCEEWLLTGEQYRKDTAMPSRLPFLNKNAATEKEKGEKCKSSRNTMGYLMITSVLGTMGD